MKLIGNKIAAVDRYKPPSSEIYKTMSKPAFERNSLKPSNKVSNIEKYVINSSGNYYKIPRKYLGRGKERLINI